MQTQGRDFWDFSVAIYDRPAVAFCCLDLQDRFGADVNLLLLGLWRATLGLASWAPGEAARAEAAISPLRAVLTPLRQARRALRPLAADDDEARLLYSDMKELELRLERLAQAYLVGFGTMSPAPSHEGGSAAVHAAALRHLRELAATWPIQPGDVPECDGLLQQLADAVSS